MAQNTSNYVHFVKDVPTNPDYPDKFKYHLVESIEELKDLLKEPCNLMGFDLEATGLSPEKDEIVSFSFAFSDREGYNVPCFHDPNENNGNPGLGEEALDLIYDYMVNKAGTVAIHNYSYESQMMEWYGFTKLTDIHKKMWMGIEPYQESVKTNVCINESDVVLRRSGQQLSIFDEPEVQPEYRMMEVKTPFTKDQINHYLKYDMSKVRYFDTMISCWLSDTNDPKVGLKKYEEKLLGWRSSSFADTLDDKINFKYTNYHDPKVIEYTCLDAMGAVGLAHASKVFYKEAKTSGQIDMKFVYVLNRCMYNLQRLDRDYLVKYEEELESSLLEMEQELYKIAGHPFNIRSTREKSVVFEELGIETEKSTKTGLRGTGKKALAVRPKGLSDKNNKFLDILLAYAATSTLKNNYIKNILDACDNKLHPNFGRFNFRTTVVPSGRLAASGDKAKTGYFINVNAQNQPKPHPQDYHCVHIDDAPLKIKNMFKNPIGSKYEYKDRIIYKTNKREYEIVRLLDYIFCPIYYLKHEHDQYPDDFPFENEGFEAKVVEGANQHLNIRSIYLPFDIDDDYILSIDYSGQELKAAAILSGEPVWEEAFSTGQDAHKATAMKVFCADGTPYNKEMRKLAKSLNFGILYGMAAYSIYTKGYAKTIEEAEDLYDRFKKGLPTLFKVLDNNAKKGKATGTVNTLFGRPIKVIYWMDNPERKIQSIGFRACCNYTIQGTGADVTKSSIIKIFGKYLNKPEWRDKVKWHSTVHDEVNFSIKKDYARELCKDINSIMTLQVPGKSFPFDTGLSLGLKWGQLFDFEYDTKTFELTHPKWSDLGEKPDCFKEKEVEYDDSFDVEKFKEISEAGEE